MFNDAHKNSSFHYLHRKCSLWLRLSNCKAALSKFLKERQEKQACPLWRVGDLSRVKLTCWGVSVLTKKNTTCIYIDIDIYRERESTKVSLTYFYMLSWRVWKFRLILFHFYDFLRGCWSIYYLQGELPANKSQKYCCKYLRLDRQLF